MIFKSVHFPNEIVATRRGSPLLIGVKTPKKLKVDFVDVEFGGIAEERKLKHPDIFLVETFHLFSRSKGAQARNEKVIRKE